MFFRPTWTLCRGDEAGRQFAQPLGALCLLLGTGFLLFHAAQMMREVSGARITSFRVCLAHCNASSGYITLLHHTAFSTSCIAVNCRNGHIHSAEKTLITACSLCLAFIAENRRGGGGCKMGSLVPTEDECKFCTRQPTQHYIV